MLLNSNTTMVGSPAPVAAAATCGCTGPFVTPLAPKSSTTVDPAVDSQGFSPNQTYQLSASGDSTFVYLTITRASDHVVVFNDSFPLQNTSWGFSPDDDRFLVDSYASGIDTVNLYDLTTGNGATPIWQSSTQTQTSGIGFSPHGKYLLYASNAGLNTSDLAVVSTSNGHVVYQASGELSGWGFSPDDDRLLINSLQSNVESADLLTLTTTSSTRIWQSSAVTSGSYIGFSPQGTYLFYASLSGTNQTALLLVKTSDGSTAFQTNFTFDINYSSGKEFGASGWGFSPDSLDQTFAYAYVSGQTSVEFAAVNLTTSTAVYADTFTSDAAWRFSHCGNVLGVLTSVGSGQVDVSLYSTEDGSIITSDTFAAASVSDVSLKSTTTDYVATVGGSDTILAPNPVGQPCPVSLSSVTLKGAQITGSYTIGGTVTLTDAAPSAGEQVTLSSDNAAAAVPSSVTVPEGQTSADFSVSTNAVGANTKVTISATAGGVTKTATLSVLAPVPASLDADSPVHGGDQSSATITLTGPAPGSGMSVDAREQRPGSDRSRFDHCSGRPEIGCLHYLHGSRRKRRERQDYRDSRRIERHGRHRGASSGAHGSESVGHVCGSRQLDGRDRHSQRNGSKRRDRRRPIQR